ALELAIARAIHDAHAAVADRALDHVLAGDDLAFAQRPFDRPAGRVGEPAQERGRRAERVAVVGRRVAISHDPSLSRLVRGEPCFGARAFAGEFAAERRVDREAGFGERAGARAIAA